MARSSKNRTPRTDESAMTILIQAVTVARVTIIPGAATFSTAQLVCGNTSPSAERVARTINGKHRRTR